MHFLLIVIWSFHNNECNFGSKVELMGQKAYVLVTVEPESNRLNNVQSLYEDLLMTTVGFDQWNSSVIYQYFGSS